MRDDSNRPSSSRPSDDEEGCGLQAVGELALAQRAEDPGLGLVEGSSTASRAASMTTGSGPQAPEIARSDIEGFRLATEPSALTGHSMISVRSRPARFTISAAIP